MWMGCATQQEIADAVNVPQRTIADWETDFSETSALEVSLNSNDFDAPIYNVWKVQKKSNTTSHFGNSEAQWDFRKSSSAEFFLKSASDGWVQARDFPKLRRPKFWIFSVLHRLKFRKKLEKLRRPKNFRICQNFGP